MTSIWYIASLWWRDHALTLDLPLNTDDAGCLTQCFHQCHYLNDYRHSNVFYDQCVTIF